MPRSTSSPIPERPNIVLIMADDMGFSDLGCYGSEIETPNLDRLAADGVRFSQFYNNAVCMPTRGSLLTGLYAHQVGATQPGLRWDNNVTIAEVLRDAGYRTLMVGKWHNGNTPMQIPTDRGFDRYWGLLSGCSNYFNPGLPRPGEPDPAHKRPGDMRHWGVDGEVIQPFTPHDPDFYTTDAFTAKAIEFLEQYGHEEQPFLLYLAHCAPHFPLHAWPDDIAKYRGRYLCGWDEVRQRRLTRLREMGLAREEWGISERDELSLRWEDVEDKDAWDLKMAVYAAMIDRMDQGIGKVLDKLREIGKEENTLVMFLSDNGGCAEHIERTPDVPPGPVDSYCTVDAPWANASNTPFRRYKVFDHEGGISTPAIARWPAVIRQAGGITHEVGHLIDFMPTFADVAGAEYPSENEHGRVLPMEGRSLAPLFRGEECEPRGPVFWECRGCRAARLGRWKIVSEGPGRIHVNIPIEPGREAWELYDMEADRCETHDLSARHPEIVKELDALWKEWNARCQHNPSQ